MNDRFTERAKTAIEKAQEAAAELGHSYVGTEHILLGILREGDGLGARVLRDNGFDEALTEAMLVRLSGRGAPGLPVQGLTPRARGIIELGVADANRLGHRYVGTEHLLMGILRDPECTAARMITGAGGELNRLYTDLINQFSTADYRAAARARRLIPDRGTTPPERDKAPGPVQPGSDGNGRPGRAGPGDWPGDGDPAGDPDPVPAHQKQPRPYWGTRRGEDGHCRGPGPAGVGGAGAG